MSQDLRICFLGDSLVNGTGDENALGWAGRLCAQAIHNGFPITYYNLGIRGETSQQIKERWERECASRLPAFCDGRIVLSCGVNDTARQNGALRVFNQDSRRNIQQILRQAKQKYKVLTVGPPPVADETHNERIQGLSQILAEASKMLEVPYIDLFLPLVADPIYRQDVLRNDGSHPQKRGYEKMAQMIQSSPNWWFHQL